MNISPKAAADIKEAVHYYAHEASVQVAARFRDEFRGATVLLAERPDIGSHRFSHLVRHIELRVWSLDRFPFRLFYSVDSVSVTIHAVVHERRRVTRGLLRSVT
ncbi:type II toxin-antitoxin system RelE/ParE family toxin [Burkholderiaceae bacterium DAT-1]|nr:type II toxin-antitoxin system RelE/ParE family toxin [Burkholderiaceae bacterium DAT-1]